MRKANPAFCDRSKSHKKLDPFNDRKMVYWLAENPFLVRSSTISVSVSVHPLSRACISFARARARARVRRRYLYPRAPRQRWEMYRHSIKYLRWVNVTIVRRNHSTPAQFYILK